ncbi:MAG: hypothetical protein J0M35_14355 [Candidatus Obscuribacter phosphatis]|uniref:Uncharacterized protein n=1 Tax=Candidatus Obscuribacter phosphatis TaxID=1906157 RepID=A0A8J7TP07_9BACT|nr:hypothetical protein [Candidatus Obscuribacter phosphatis]
MATLYCEDEEYISAFTIKASSFQEVDLVKEVQQWQHIELTLTSGNRALSFASDFDPEKRLSMDDVLARHTTDANQLAKDATAGKNATGNKNTKDLAEAVLDIQTVANAYVLCRKPQDEINHLTKQLKDLIEGKKNRVLFEPAEPSFELALEVSAGSYRVECFIDAGNVETGIYRWDALGVRFFTDQKRIANFIEELENEFKL